jgi:chemotaxis protein MotB
MAKNKIPTPDEPIEECPPCPQVAPLYLGTFSDMAILLMAFFVILISRSI